MVYKLYINFKKVMTELTNSLCNYFLMLASLIQDSNFLEGRDYSYFVQRCIPCA